MKLRKKWMWMTVVLFSVILAAPWVYAGDIVVGIIDELSGSGAGWGNRHVYGYKLAFDEINASGGARGVGKFKLIVEDSGSNPSQAVNAAKKLIYRDKVDVLMAACNSSTTMAILPVFTEAGVPDLNSCSSSALITEKGSKWIARTQIISARSMGGMVNFAIDSLGAKKIAVWSDTNEYGKAASEAALARLKERGITPVIQLTHTTKDKIFTPQLLKLKESGADTVAAAIYYEEMSLILKQANQMGLKVNWVSTDVLGTPVFFDLAGDLANGVYVSLLFTPDEPSPKVQNFLAKVKEKYNIKADNYTALGYDAAYILKDAVERAGSTDKAKVMAAIMSSHYDGLCGKTEFSPNGDDIKAFWVTKVQDGKYVPVKRVK